MERAREEPGGFVAEMAMMDAALHSQREMARLWMALNAIGRFERPSADAAPSAPRAAEPGGIIAPVRRW